MSVTLILGTRDNQTLSTNRCTTESPSLLVRSRDKRNVLALITYPLLDTYGIPDVAPILTRPRHTHSFNLALLHAAQTCSRPTGMPKSGEVSVNRNTNSTSSHGKDGISIPCLLCRSHGNAFLFIYVHIARHPELTQSTVIYDHVNYVGVCVTSIEVFRPKYFRHRASFTCQHLWGVS